MRRVVDDVRDSYLQNKGFVMRLHEYEAADVFESMGIPVPRRGVAADVEGPSGWPERSGTP
jgi:hypothetical protein